MEIRKATKPITLGNIEGVLNEYQLQGSNLPDWIPEGTKTIAHYELGDKHVVNFLPYLFSLEEDIFGIQHNGSYKKKLDGKNGTIQIMKECELEKHLRELGPIYEGVERMMMKQY